MNPELKQAWTEIIIDHSQFPRRHGTLENATHSGQGENPFCGDRISLSLEINDRGMIEDARFQATGCAISTASASMLAAHIVGRSVTEAEALFATVHAMLMGAGDGVEPEDEELAALQLVKQYPARVKCATLSWHVLRHALRGDADLATTE